MTTKRDFRVRHLQNQLAQSVAKAGIVRTARAVAVDPRHHPDQPASATLRIAFLFNRPGHDLPPQPRRQKFFASISRSVDTSIIDSARSFFSRAFSSSRAFSRLASDTSMPPYLLRQV